MSGTPGFESWLWYSPARRFWASQLPVLSLSSPVKCGSSPFYGVIVRIKAVSAKDVALGGNCDHWSESVYNY